MRQEVEEAIDSLGDANQFGDEVANTYRMASKAYREYHDIYKKGSMAAITRKGPLGEESNMTPEQVLGTVFDKGNVKAADQLIQAIGETKAKEMVIQYANYDLLRKATNPTGEINGNGLMRWVAQNRPILKRYGIENEYSDIVKAKRIVDEATLLKTTFEKSQASKVLGVDAKKAIETIFSGRGALNSGQTTKDVFALVKGNKAAENGFKQSFTDYAVSKLNSTLVEATASPTGSFIQFNKLYQKLLPAMRVLYTDKEMAVLLNMKRAYEIALRNTKSPIGGGSDTYELSTQMIATMTGPMLTSSYKMVNAIRVVGRIFEKYQSDQISKVINKAIFNPEYAETLLMLANGPKPVAEKRLANLIGANLMEETVRIKKETK
jgi:hypothetical protein